MLWLPHSPAQNSRCKSDQYCWLYYTFTALWKTSNGNIEVRVSNNTGWKIEPQGMFGITAANPKRIPTKITSSWLHV